MSLTNYQLLDLGKRMNVPLESPYFKDELPLNLKSNVGYIINLEDEEDENGDPNTGSHWCALYIREYPNEKREAIYFDPYGTGCPQDVEKSMKKTLGKSIPHTTKQIQDLNSDMCGWFCLAFLYYLHTYPKRTKDLYQDVSNFLSFFDDLSKDENMIKKNEFILKHFFRSEDPKLRKKIDVDDYSHLENSDTAIPVEVNHT